MKFFSRFAFVLIWLLPNWGVAQESFDLEDALAGTWVFAEKESWDLFRTSPEWRGMTPEAQLDYQTTMWPKALAQLLFTAYRFNDDELVVIFKENQQAVPTEIVSEEDKTVVLRLGSGSNAPIMKVHFLDANYIRIENAGSVNYYIWKRKGAPYRP